MGRPAGLTMCLGYRLVSDGRPRKKIAAPLTDPADDSKSATARAGGVLLLRLSHALGAKACDVFTPEELAERIAAHAERVERELAALPPLRLGGGRKAGFAKPAISPLEKLAGRKLPLPLGRSWDSLRVVSCGNCRKLLLGESDEYLRPLAQAMPAGRWKAAGHVAKLLPPAVARRDGLGRPVCAACLAAGDE